MSSHLMHNYQRLPISFTRGEGVTLYDAQGNAYLDALAGIAVCGLGYAHPKINAALQTQSNAIWHTSNLFEIPGQESAAEKLCNISGMERAFFCNSGTEANEAALKLTRLHARAKDIANPTVLTFQGGFHGRTFGAMAATANPHIREHFEPQLENFAYLPFNNLDAVKAYSANPNVVAVMIECIQGEGGVHPANIDFIKGLRKLCDANGWLLICDEVQVGMMRSGKWFGFQYADILPDVMTMAKGLGNGIPVGACLARGAAAEYIKPGYHGTTFGGSPLVMAVVNKVLDIYAQAGFAEHVNHIGECLLTQLKTALADVPCVQEIRGKGLMIGVELAAPIEHLVQKGLDAGIVINVTADKVVRLLPPLIYSEENVALLVDKLSTLLRQC